MLDFATAVSRLEPRGKRRAEQSIRTAGELSIVDKLILCICVRGGLHHYLVASYVTEHGNMTRNAILALAGFYRRQSTNMVEVW